MNMSKDLISQKTTFLIFLFSFLLWNADANREHQRTKLGRTQTWLIGSNPECNFNCKRTKRRKYFCGNNGRTYNTECEQRKAKCLDPMLTTRSGKCDEATCLQARTHVLKKIEASDSKKPYYVPNCTADGRYAPRQCNNDFHACWCVSPDGKVLERSSPENVEPSCTTGNVRRSTEACTSAKRETLLENIRRQIRRQYRKATPRAEVPPTDGGLLRLALEWEFAIVDKNKDENISPREIRSFMKKLHVRECVNAFSSLCDTDGNRNISKSEWVGCLFAHVTTSTRAQVTPAPSTPPTADILSVHRNTVSKAINSLCPREERTDLMEKIKAWILSEAKPRSPDTSADKTSEEQENQLISAKFSQLDANGNGLLNAREMKPMRRRFRRDRFKECFLSSCDANDDDDLSADEFKSCIVTSKRPNCANERREALKSQRAQEAVYVPECEESNSRYFSRIQCHSTTSYCWCAKRETGRPIPGTSIRGERPICESSTTSPISPSSVLVIPGCNKPQAFITSIQNALVKKMAQQARISATDGTSVPSSFNSEVAIWFFQSIDGNNDNQLSRKEAKAVRKALRKKVKPKKCFRKYMRYCDINKNKKVTQDEFLTCLHGSNE